MKKIPVIYASAFFMAITINSVALGIVFFAKELFQASPSQVGGLNACYNLAYLLSCISCQALVGRWMPQKSLVVAVSGLLAGMLITYFAPGLVWAYTGQIVCGIGTSFFWPPLMGWLSEGYEGPELARITGFYNLCWSSGTIISPLLSGFLSDMNATYPLVFSIAAYAATLAVFTYNFIKANKERKTEAAESSSKTFGHEAFMRYPSWVGVACAWFTVGFLLSVFPLAMEEQMNLSRSHIGFILMFRALSATVSMTVLGMVVFWQFRPLQLVCGHAMLAASILALGFVKEPIWAIILVTLTGLGAGQAYTNSIFHGVAGSKRRTLRMAIHEILLSVGSVVGSYTGGIIYQHWGLAYACSTAAAVMMAAVLFDIVCWKACNNEIEFLDT